MTILHIALRHGAPIEIIRLLLDRGAAINAFDRVSLFYEMDLNVQC